MAGEQGTDGANTDLSSKRTLEGPVKKANLCDSRKGGHLVKSTSLRYFDA